MRDQRFLSTIFILILLVSLSYAPFARAEGVINTMANAFSALTNFITNAAIGFWEVTVGGVQCGLGGSCDAYNRAKCRYDTPTQKFDSSRCEVSGFLIIGASDPFACQAGAQITFYNNFGPVSPEEQNSTVQIFKFELPESSRYWPWNDPYNDANAQSAAVTEWLGTLDQKVGDGLVSPYDFKEGSYFMSESSYLPAAPLVEVPYNQVCDANGICNIIDQTFSQDSFFAYLAKTTATYDLEIPYTDEEVVYDDQVECPDGYTLQSDGMCKSNTFGYRRNDGYWIPAYEQVDPSSYINYNGGKVYVGGRGNVKLKESDKPHNIDVIYPTIPECSAGYTIQNDGRCKSINPIPGGNIFSNNYRFINPSSYYINYNGGRISVSGGSSVTINDSRLTEPLIVSHPVQSNYINYNGGTIPVVNGLVTDTDGNTYNPNSIPEGTPDSPKFLVTYQVSGSELVGYNGGTLIGGLSYGFFTSKDQYGSGQYNNDATGNYYYFGGEQYRGSGTSLSIVTDEYNAPSPDKLKIQRQGKFLSVTSGQGVVDSYVRHPYDGYGLADGNGILGPFRPPDDSVCSAVSAPAIIQAACDSVSLESPDKRLFKVLRREKGTADFTELSNFDFSGSAVLTDTGLQPHTTYEYAFLESDAAVGLAVPDTQISEAYTLCRPKCRFLSGSKDVVELSGVDLDWQCDSDPAVISCKIQSTDSQVSAFSGLGSEGMVQVSPSEDAEYTLSCTNIDGTTIASPFKVNLLKPGIKEVKP